MSGWVPLSHTTASRRRQKRWIFITCILGPWTGKWQLSLLHHKDSRLTVIRLYQTALSQKRVYMALEFAFKFEHDMLSVMLVPKVLKYKIKIYQWGRDSRTQKLWASNLFSPLCAAIKQWSVKTALQSSATCCTSLGDTVCWWDPYMLKGHTLIIISRGYVPVCKWVFFLFIHVNLSVECPIKASSLLKKCTELADNWFGQWSGVSALLNLNLQTQQEPMNYEHLLF